MNYEQIQKISNELFGGTITFWNGKINNWKVHFSEDHKKEFKQIAGNLLIELGYENSTDW